MRVSRRFALADYLTLYAGHDGGTPTSYAAQPMIAHLSNFKPTSIVQHQASGILIRIYVFIWFYGHDDLHCLQRTLSSPTTDLKSNEPVNAALNGISSIAFPTPSVPFVIPKTPMQMPPSSNHQTLSLCWNMLLRKRAPPSSSTVPTATAAVAVAAASPPSP
jgi:hypothetical protein